MQAILDKSTRSLQDAFDFDKLSKQMQKYINSISKTVDKGLTKGLQATLDDFSTRFEGLSFQDNSGKLIEGYKDAAAIIEEQVKAIDSANDAISNGTKLMQEQAKEAKRTADVVVEAEKRKRRAASRDVLVIDGNEDEAAKTTKEIFNRMSKNSSIKDIRKNLEQLDQEAIHITKVLGEMYDEGIRESEKYLTLQYKLSKIFDNLGKMYGKTIKASGARDKVELLAMVLDGIQQRTGFDIGDTRIMDALWNNSTDYSLFNKSLSKFSMWNVADMLRIDGAYGDWVDTQKKLDSATETTTDAIEEQTAAMREQERVIESATKTQ